MYGKYVTIVTIVARKQEAQQRHGKGTTGVMVFIEKT